MHRLVEHIHGNVIGYLALFCALSGIGYAAITIPRSSVGTQQLRNGAVTPRKLNAEQSGGKVRTGQDGPGAWVIFWPGQDNRCRTIGNVDTGPGLGKPGNVLSGR